MHTLTTPASISAAVTTFTAPSGATLAASTTYYVVISTTSSGISLSRTNATAEDSGGVSGWSIADSRRFFGSSGWNTTTRPIRMRVNGPAATNHPATGAPVVTGTAQVGEQLTADISNIGDPDGIANADFEYQWIANDGTTDSDISGATGETYRPLLAHLAQTIKVRVSFDDDNDNAESLSSAATAAVTASTYGQVIWSAKMKVGRFSAFGVTRLGFFVGAPSINAYGTLEPGEFLYDGAAISVPTLFHEFSNTDDYVTLGLDSGLGEGRFNLYLDGQPLLIEEAGEQGTLSNIIFNDHAISWSNNQEVEVRLTVNRPATGAPAITGTLEVGETLTAGISAIMDEDGVPADDQFAYQWISNDSDIDGATDSTYTLVQADAGKTIKVRVSFTDNAKFPESLTSAATAALEMGALVSNIGQTDDSTGDLSAFDQAQAFTTGTNSGGYTLESVEIHLTNTSPPFPTHTVSIWTDSSGSPGSSLVTLTNPASVVDSVNTYTTTGVRLAANTTYFIVVDSSPGANDFGFIRNTSSDSEDAGAASGWSIGNSSLYPESTEGHGWTA